MPYKIKIKLPQQTVADERDYNLRIMKKNKTKDQANKASKRPLMCLRTRTVKDYSEMPDIIDSEPEEKEVVSTIRMPIYKTMKLIEEKVQSQEEVYEFVDDLEVSGKKIKRKKKSVRKPSVKRAKKAAGLQYYISRFQKIKAEPIQNIKEQQDKQSNTKSEKNVKHNIYTNIEIPENLQYAGDSTIAEASTVIISDQGLQQNHTSSPNNSDSFQSNNEDSSMSNPSLTRQSTSPIRKEVDNLFIESPTRSEDDFSGVQKVVHSTPQITRVLEEQEKKPMVQINLNKSIHSEDTFHASSCQNMAVVTPIQEENISVISNVDMTESVSISNVKQASPQQKEQLPLKGALSITSFENSENDQIMQEDIQPMSSIQTISKKGRNNILDLYKSSQMKIDQLLCHLRFENIMQSVKQIVSSESNEENSNSQKENQNPNSEAGTSKPKTLKTIILRQSNLNNFLNVDNLPEETHISTIHGIFDDVNNSPVSGKQPQVIFEESNTENEFGLKNQMYSDRSSPKTSVPIIQKKVPIIATARDVARSVKGKLFLKARVKSSLTRRDKENLVKKTLLKNIFKKTAPEPKALANEEIIEKSHAENEKNKGLMDDETEVNKSVIEAESESNNSFVNIENDINTDVVEDENPENASPVEDENQKNANPVEDENPKNASPIEDENPKNTSPAEDENQNKASPVEDENEGNANLKDAESINISLDPKKAILDSISFSDTFDCLSENGEDISIRLPEEIPMFVDLEPVHFSQPPRRSYTKTRKSICVNTSKAQFEDQSSEEDDYDKPKKKRVYKKRVSRHSKEERKKMQEWINSVNETFNEIEHFNLTIEKL